MVENIFLIIAIVQLVLILILANVLRYSIKKIQIQKTVINELKENRASLIGLISIRDNYPN